MAAATRPDPRPFTISVPEAELADLARRLAATRLPPRIDPDDWKHGVAHDALVSLLDHWREAYDWRATEARLNARPQYLVDIDGYDIHFLHLRSPRDDAMPLIMTHGWPGAFTEFEATLDALLDPGTAAQPAFHLVVPSLPGFGWSSPGERPVTSRVVAGLWRRLMERLGYASYLVQGGDWGSAVGSWLAIDAPLNVRALHLNMLGLKPFVDPAVPLSGREQAWLAATRHTRRDELGYVGIQSTRPLTLAFGLTDSPAGLAAWLLEKFRVWSGPGGSFGPFETSRLIDVAMIYWLNRSAYAASWPYYAARHQGDIAMGPGERVEVPTAYLACPDDIQPPAPDEWVARGYDCRYRRDLERGGHFIAFEQPEIFVADLRCWFGRFGVGPAASGTG